MAAPFPGVCHKTPSGGNWTEGRFFPISFEENLIFYDNMIMWDIFNHNVYNKTVSYTIYHIVKVSN